MTDLLLRVLPAALEAGRERRRLGRPTQPARIDGPHQGSLGFDNMQNRPIKGTTDWRKYEVVLDVPQESVAIALGILLSGKGQAWMREVKLEEVGADVPTTSQEGHGELPEKPGNLDFAEDEA